MFLVETQLEVLELCFGICLVFDESAVRDPVELDGAVLEGICDVLIFVDGDGEVVVFFEFVEFKAVDGRGEFGA